MWVLLVFSNPSPHFYLPDKGMLIAFVFCCTGTHQAHGYSCRGHQNFEKLSRALSKVKYALLTRCAHKTGHRGSGCTSICFADGAEQFKHHLFWHLEQSSCSWGHEQEEQRGDTFNWRVPWSLHPTALQTAASRQSGNGNCPRPISMKPQLCCGCICLYIPKSTTGDECQTLKLQKGSSALVFQANQAHPKCSNSENQRQTSKKWPSPKHCTVTTVAGPHTHQSKHRMVETTMLCCDFYTRVLFKYQFLPLWLWKCFAEENSKKTHPLQDSTQHAASEVDPITNIRQEVGTFRTTSNFHFFTLEESLFRLSP